MSYNMGQVDEIQGALAGMKAHANKRNFLWRATCWLVSFTLAFTLFGTPAYAAEAVEDGVEVAPAAVETASETPAQVQETKTAPEPVVPASDPAEKDLAAAAEPSADSAVTEAEETTPAAPETDSEPSEDPDPVTDPSDEEDAVQDVSYSIVGGSSYDYETNTITYTVSVANTSETNSAELTLDGYFNVDNTGSFYPLDLPATVQLPAGEAIIYTCPVVLQERPAQGAPLSVTCHLEARNANNLDQVVTDDLKDTLSTPTAQYAYEVDITTEMLDSEGNLRDSERLAVPGDTVVFFVNVKNTGSEDLEDVTLAMLSAGFELEGDWAAPSTIPVGSTATFVARYHVTNADVGDPEDDNYGLVRAEVAVNAAGVAQTHEKDATKVAKPLYQYTLNYYAEDEGVRTYLGTYTSEKLFEETFTAPDAILNQYVPEGFRSLSMADMPELTLSEDAEENVIDVVYERDVDYAIAYTVNYYKDSVDPANLVGSDTAEGAYKTQIPYEQGKYAPTGYKAVGEVSGAEIITMNPADNVVNVVYGKDTFGYTVNYYKDSISEENFLDSTTGEATFEDVVTLDVDTLNATLPAVGYKAKTADQNATIAITANEAENVYNVVYQRDSYEYTISYWLDRVSPYGSPVTTVRGTAEYGSTVHVTQDVLNRYVQAGYKAKTVDDELDITIDAFAANNHIDVVYERDSFRYTVNYYKDSVAEENFLNSYSGTQLWDSTVYNIPVNQYLPAGYKPIDERPHIVIYADESKNVLNVVYQKQDDLSYTVNYYRDSVSAENFLGSDAGVGTLDANIPYIPGRFAPVGYNTEGIISGNTVISVNGDNNVMNVVYQKADYGYTVNYYADEVSPENLLGSSAGRAPYQTEITYEAGAFLPEGYDQDNVEVSGTRYVTVDEANNVLNVVYAKSTRLSYTVNYYADSTDGQLLNSVTGYGTYGDPIPYTDGAFLPVGYVSPGQVSGATTIGATPEENVLNVVYTKGMFGYTVNYYKDSVDPTNLLGSEQGSALYLSTIPYTNGAYVPEGYVQPGLVSGSTAITFDPAQNVLNVVYQPGRFEYMVNYYKGSVSEDNLITSTTYDPRPFGTTVTLSANELNSQVPEGFTPFTQGTSVQISSDPAQNVVNVVFYPNFDAFYAGGVDALNTTYNGEKHYVAPKGVVEGDIITYIYDGTTQTRVVGSDDNIGAEFQEITNGDLPVLVTITRAGITSNALQTIVNIAAPQPVVDDPDNNNAQPDGTTPNPSVPTPGQVLDAISQWVNPVIAAPTPSYDPNLVAEDLAGTTTAEETTIEDDLNPLASSPLSTKNLSQQGTTIFGILLLILASLCAAGAIALLLMRKRTGHQAEDLKGSAVAAARVKISRMGWYAVILSVAAVVLYALWVILRI